MKKAKKIAVIGAGPAGLTAAYILGKEGQNVCVFEKDPVYVGGISRTETYKGYLFDIGGHRFFSKSSEVIAFWNEILGADLIEVPRVSRIYYAGKYFSYPLVASEALQKLGWLNAAQCLLSYLAARMRPRNRLQSFEDWVTYYFGGRLYRQFFKTYTEKVWGMPCSEISADWASQRIKGLSLIRAAYYALAGKKEDESPDKPKTLTGSFLYPRKGPGMMWETCAMRAKDYGVDIRMNASVEKLFFENGKWSVLLHNGILSEGYDCVISSAPLREISAGLVPSLPERGLQAARQLRYRDFLTVILIMPDSGSFSDNWIYIHDPDVLVGRIQNFKSWSTEMVPDASMVCYGMEYFCFEGDHLWEMPDQELIELAKRELEKIGLGNAGSVTDGCVVRQPKAYPVYDHQYSRHVEQLRSCISAYPGLYLTGRNGMHKYNNQDHSMMTAMLAARNILAGEDVYDLWKVNQDAEYHEQLPADPYNQGRMVPRTLAGKAAAKQRQITAEA